MNIQAFSTFSIRLLPLVYVPAFFQVFENISFSSWHACLCRKAWAISSKADTLTTHSPKTDQFLAKPNRVHVKSQRTDSANRKTRRENVQGDLHLQPRVLVLQLQPNQKAFLGHLPRLHSWIKENLGVLGEPGWGQHQSRTAPRHKERVWPWGDEGLRKSFGFEVTSSVLFCWFSPPPHTHQEERRMEKWHLWVQSFSWGGAEGLRQIQGQCVLHNLKTPRATRETLSPPQRNRLHATELGLKNYCNGKWYAIYILLQYKKND